MTKNYFMACVAAGLNEEEIKEIERMLDADYKRLGRRTKAQERLAESYGVVTMSVSAMIGDSDMDSIGDFDIPADINIEEQILHEMELEELRKCLGELKADDKDFLLECFDSEIGCTKAGERRGLTKNQAHYKKCQLLEKLRERMK